MEIRGEVRQLVNLYIEKFILLANFLKNFANWQNSPRFSPMAKVLLAKCTIGDITETPIGAQEIKSFPV